MSAHAPPLYAALDYCARKLLAELERMPDARDDAMLAHLLTPTTAALLRWWCSAGRCNTRVDNFHPGQRQAILHTVIAHEWLQTDDPDQLYRLACDPLRVRDEPPIAAGTPRYAGHVLRLAPGIGLRWVAQALLVWQWANDADARASGREDARFSGDFALLAATGAVRQRLQDALFGPADATGHRHVAQSSPIRHARLFLPPPLLGPFRDWLDRQSKCADGDSALHIADAVGETDERRPTVPPITFVAGVGARMLGGGRRMHAAAGDGSVDHVQPAQASLLWIDLAFAESPTAAGIASAPIVEYPLERAIRDGAAKLPVLESTQYLGLPPLRTRPPRRRGLRPQLSRAHRRLLEVGLAALEARDAGFTMLDPARRPKLLVLCDVASLVHGVRWWLHVCGMAADDIDARIAIDTLSAPTKPGDARICVIVLLRSRLDAGTDARASIAALGAGLPPLWPESDFATLRGDSRERAALGRAPGHLLDALSVVEHPQCHDGYADLLRTGLAVHAGEHDLADAIGDLTVAGLRADADAYEIALPHTTDSRTAEPERLGDLPRRVLRARQSMPVRKCVYTHAGWSTHDSGLGRAFLECAEHDSAIESHCLLDPRRHAVRTRDALLAKGASLQGWPDALVRTADAVYLVAFLPSCPAQAPASASGQASGASERALARWCADVNALPPAQRQHRRWHRVHLQAPLFWSWKRSQGTLSALLAALAGTAPLMRRDRIASAAD